MSSGHGDGDSFGAVAFDDDRIDMAACLQSLMQELEAIPDMPEEVTVDGAALPVPVAAANAAAAASTTTGVRSRAPTAGDATFFTWMSRFMEGDPRPVDPQLDTIWRDAGIAPTDPDDLLTTLRVVMAVAYEKHDPELAERLDHVTVLDHNEFSPYNTTGSVAPPHVYSITTAVLIKRAWCGEAIDPETKQPMTVEEEVAMHIDSSQDHDYPAPAHPENAIVAPPSASNILNGPFRHLLLDVAAIKKKQASRMECVATSAGAAVLTGAKIAIRSQTVELRPWKDFVTTTFANMIRTHDGSAPLPETLRARAQENISAFQAHFQEYTPGMGHLSQSAKYFSGLQTSKESPFAYILAPYGDHFGDEKLDIGLQSLRRKCHEQALQCNNHMNVHLIALLSHIICDAHRFQADGEVSAPNASVFIMGPADHGKTHLMQYIMKCMIAGTGSWEGTLTPASGHGNGDSFGGVAWYDEAQPEAAGVDPRNCTDNGVIRAGISKGAVSEVVDSRLWNFMKRQSTTATTTIKSTTVTQNGLHKDIITETTSTDGVVLGANIAWAGLSRAARGRRPAFHMRNTAAHMTYKRRGELRNRQIVDRELQDANCVEAYLQQLINCGMLPDPAPTAQSPGFEHTREYLEAMRSQLAHECPDHDACFAGTRKWGFVRVLCRTLVVKRTVQLMALTGMGRDEQGKVSLEHLLHEARCALFCPITYAIFAAELAEVTAPRFFVEVVEELMKLMGAIYNPDTCLCERDSSFWERKEVHRRPTGDLTFNNLYLRRTGYLSTNGGGGNEAKSSSAGEGEQPGGGRYSNSTEDSYDPESKTYAKLLQLARDLNSRMQNRYTLADTLFVLAMLTSNVCFDRAPGFDWDRQTRSRDRAPAAGLRFAGEALEVHQRVFWFFRREFPKDLNNGMMAHGSTVGVGLRGVADDNGLFEITTWRGGLRRSYSTGAGSRPMAEVPSLIPNRITDGNRIRAELARAQAELQAAREEQVTGAKVRPVHAKGREPAAFVSHVIQENKTRLAAAVQEATRRVRVLEDGTAKITAGELTYDQWRATQCIVPSSSSSSSSSSSEYKARPAAAAAAVVPAIDDSDRERVVRDWGQIERDAHARFLPLYTVTKASDHWTSSVSKLQRTYGNVMEKAKVVSDYLRRPIEPYDSSAAFNYALDQSTKAVITHLQLIRSINTLRPMDMSLARRIWYHQVGTALVCPPMMHIINETDMTPETTGQLHELTQSVFDLHQAIYTVCDQWRRIRLFVAYESSTRGGLASLYTFRQPDSAMHVQVTAMANMLLDDVRRHIAAINQCAVYFGDRPLSHELVQALMARVDCNDKLAGILLREPCLEDTQEVTDIIFAATYIPLEKPCSTGGIVAVMVSNSAPAARSAARAAAYARSQAASSASSSSQQQQPARSPPPPPPSPPSPPPQTIRMPTVRVQPRRVPLVEEQEGVPDDDGMSQCLDDIINQEQELRQLGDLGDGEEGATMEEC